ncbi:MAG: response regulator [Chloroflexota bacterium]
MTLDRRKLAVESVSNAKEAIEKLKTEAGFTLVITELDLPGQMTGPQFVKFLPTDPRWRNLPVMICTSVADEDKVKAAIQAGVRHYLLKPVKPSVLAEKVEEILARAVPVLEGKFDAMSRLELASEAEYRLLVESTLRYSTTSPRSWARPATATRSSTRSTSRAGSGTCRAPGRGARGGCRGHPQRGEQRRAAQPGARPRDPGDRHPARGAARSRRPSGPVEARGDARAGCACSRRAVPAPTPAPTLGRVSGGRSAARPRPGLVPAPTLADGCAAPGLATQFAIALGHPVPMDQCRGAGFDHGPRHAPHRRRLAVLGEHGSAVGSIALRLAPGRSCRSTTQRIRSRHTGATAWSVRPSAAGRTAFTGGSELELDPPRGGADHVEVAGREQRIAVDDEVVRGGLVHGDLACRVEAVRERTPRNPGGMCAGRSARSPRAWPAAAAPRRWRARPPVEEAMTTRRREVVAPTRRAGRGPPRGRGGRSAARFDTRERCSMKEALDMLAARADLRDEVAAHAPTSIESDPPGLATKSMAPASRAGRGVSAAPLGREVSRASRRAWGASP